ncbi:MAG: type II toxin-antitoxin system prevent-host-death family antitoxin [Actinomycetota bacterium]|nr:type II toxin-antitoxin system prevent-host-death family antitoxin [Actinomycetota bacterium]MDA2974436.1 type II toxin-antitoxin system prevent-host-death family antitoxin [Actinomycetota bacterium]
MHRVTIRELRHRGGEVVDRARRGEKLTITRDGEAVAVLTGVPREAISLDELRRRRSTLPQVDPRVLRQDIDQFIDQSM